MNELRTCKRCDEPALPDRKLCQAHTDMQKVYQSNYQKKKTGQAPKDDRAIVTTARKQQSPRITKVSVTRIVPASELAAAVEQLREELAVLERAKTILARMAEKAC